MTDTTLTVRVSSPNVDCLTRLPCPVCRGDGSLAIGRCGCGCDAPDHFAVCPNCRGRRTFRVVAVRVTRDN